MPLLLDDLDASTSAGGAVVQAASPRFFSSKLTGNGTNRVGLLNSELLPCPTDHLPRSMNLPNIRTKSTNTQNKVETVSIPLAPMRREAQIADVTTVPLAHVDDRFELDLSSNKNTTKTPQAMYFSLSPQALQLITLTNDNAPNTRDLAIEYRMELSMVPQSCTLPQNEQTRGVAVNFLSVYQNTLQTTLDFSTNPLDFAKDFIEQHLSMIGISADNLGDELTAWLRDFSIYDAIAHQAQIWSGDEIGELYAQYISDVSAKPSTDALNTLADQLRYLENYNVQLSAYRTIHAALVTEFNEQNVSILVKRNLNLLMNHTLALLADDKAQLATPAQPTGQVTISPRLSQQQKLAVTTHEPLVMTQAGAGTGKSTVILERIQYLESCGIDPADITVISFTNAAADNITEKNPRVGSMTIARMIIDIYALNHPTHLLSSLETIINSIDIFFPANPLAQNFNLFLTDVLKNKVSAFTKLNTFIEANYDDIVKILDTIKQTSLELQIIMCYQKISSMQEPAHLLSKYLIIDEVQDNSIFEFIYVLNYVARHQASLFIVGDASQTLYEFRSANPRALNALESSGVFATFKLTTNYRSNQEILDFANVVLGGLETNQFAQIQLQANNLTKPTAQSFQDAVTVDYRLLSKMRDFSQGELTTRLKSTVFPDFVKPALARGEQVAILAYSRNDVKQAENALKDEFPTHHVASLVSDRPFASDVFSKYIKYFWNDVLQTQPNNAPFTITQGIKNSLGKLTKRAGDKAVIDAVLGMTSKWWIENAATINGWAAACMRGAMPPEQYFQLLRESLLSFEIKLNQDKLNVTKQRNQQRKAENLTNKPDLVVSTIHGAKGLEFDNVIVIYKEADGMTQDAKRMYYVAFTRAMKREYVLAYGTTKQPPLVTNYEGIVTLLEEQDAAAALPAAGAPLAVAAPDADETAQAHDTEGEQ